MTSPLLSEICLGRSIAGHVHTGGRRSTWSRLLLRCAAAVRIIVGAVMAVVLVGIVGTARRVVVAIRIVIAHSISIGVLRGVAIRIVVVIARCR